MSTCLPHILKSSKLGKQLGLTKDTAFNTIAEIRELIDSNNQNKEIKSNEVKGENITSKGSEFAKKLTNVGNLVGLIYKGKEYVNSEHAYQTWKSGEFNQAGYNLKGGKVRGGKIGDTFSIMTDILTEKLKQHPDLVQGITERGGLEYLQKSTHNVIGDKFWESTGQNKFIEALTQAYKNVNQPTEIKPSRLQKQINKQINEYDRIEVVDRYTDAEVKANPDKVYVFGDNLDRKGTGGQAQIRNNPNAFGIATKIHPTNNEDAFMSDKDLEANKKVIDADTDRILSGANIRYIVFPKDGLGTGLAKLKEKAPLTYEYLKETLIKKFGFNNDTGELQPINHQSTAEEIKPKYVFEKEQEAALGVEDKNIPTGTIIQINEEGYNGLFRVVNPENDSIEFIPIQKTEETKEDIINKLGSDPLTNCE